MACRLSVLLVCGVTLAGCGAPSKQPAADRRAAPAATTQRAHAANAAPARAERLTISDPCPSRLHDVCGPLLRYMDAHYRLPERIEDLRQLPGAEDIGDLACPTTKQRYIYNPAGVVGANVSRRAVLYDASPSHSGYRWAVVVREATPNAPFIAEVVAWPESRFPKTAGN